MKIFLTKFKTFCDKLVRNFEQNKTAFIKLDYSQHSVKDMLWTRNYKYLAFLLIGAPISCRVLSIRNFNYFFKTVIFEVMEVFMTRYNRRHKDEDEYYISRKLFYTGSIYFTNCILFFLSFII